MYIEIIVKSRPAESSAQQDWKQPLPEVKIPKPQLPQIKKERRIGKNNEPETEEDFKNLEDFHQRESDYKQQIELLI